MIKMGTLSRTSVGLTRMGIALAPSLPFSLSLSLFLSVRQFLVQARGSEKRAHPRSLSLPPSGLSINDVRVWTPLCAFGTDKH